MSNIIYKEDKAYKILRKFNISTFQNKDGSTNPQVLGMWVQYLGGNHVLQQQHQLFICEEIKDAIILEENVQ